MRRIPTWLRARRQRREILDFFNQRPGQWFSIANVAEGNNQTLEEVSHNLFSLSNKGRLSGGFDQDALKQLAISTGLGTTVGDTKYQSEGDEDRIDEIINSAFYDLMKFRLKQA